MNKKSIYIFFIILLTLFTINTAKSNKLYIYNWSEYIPNELLQKFTYETGIKVIYSTYESNEEMYSKLKITGAKDYDIVFPSTYYMEKLINDGLLQKIDTTKIKNYDNILPQLLDESYNPSKAYGIPYAYGFTAIAYDSSKIKDPITSWNDLWNPKYKGQVILLNDMRDVFSATLLSLGLDPNTKNEGDIKLAFEKLKQLMPSVASFNSDSPEVSFLQNDGTIGMIWNGSAFRGFLENPDIKVAYPKEGSILWLDNMTILKDSKNVDNAYKFIDFILRPENALKITEQMGFSTANNKVKYLMPKSWQNNHILFPEHSVFKTLVMNKSVGDALPIYSKYWNLLKLDN